MQECHGLFVFAFQREYITEESLVAAALEMIWGYFSEGELAPTVIVLLHEVYIHGVPYDLGVIADVATRLEYHKSVKLLVHSLSVMKEAGQALSYLMPFAYPFYRIYGGEMTLEQHVKAKQVTWGEECDSQVEKGTDRRLSQPRWRAEG